LGAEFLHGEARAVAELARKARLVSYEVSGSHQRTRNGAIVPLRDFWGPIAQVLDRIGDSRRADESLADALSRKPGGRTLAQARKLTFEFVEGFHAADASRVSVRAVAAASPTDDPQAKRMGRLVEGFVRVPETMASGLHDVLTLNCRVRAVRWRRHRVALYVDQDGVGNGIVEARAAIITIPLGVLAAGSDDPACVIFDPRPTTLDRHAARLAMGHVVRIVLLVEEDFWARAAVHAGDDVRDGCFSFLHTHERDFAIWWTQFPVRTPLVVGWAGGSRAVRLTREQAPEVRAIAVQSLARSLGLAARRLAPLVRYAWLHDWTADPFARGAYSYALVGGQSAARALAQPVQGTLVFAGEATDANGENGTVHGAIDSGYRAASRLLRILG
jgi:monoamine oxidase